MGVAASNKLCFSGVVAAKKPCFSCVVAAHFTPTEIPCLSGVAARELCFSGVVAGVAVTPLTLSWLHTEQEGEGLSVSGLKSPVGGVEVLSLLDEEFAGVGGGVADTAPLREGSEVESATPPLTPLAAMKSEA